MQKIPPISGWHWLQQGWALFLRQPLILSGLFACNILTVSLLSLTISLLKLPPSLGTILMAILMPTLNMSLMNACTRIANGEKVDFEVWRYTFRSPAFPVLCRLGLMYGVANVLSLLLADLIDHGAMMEFVNGKTKIDPQGKNLSKILPGMAMLTLFMLPAIMASWFAPLLISWKNMPLLKALFFSFFAVWRALLAFIVLILSATGVMFGIAFVCGLILAVIGPALGGLLLVPVMMTFCTVLYCSAYPAYIQIFGAEQGGTVPTSQI